MAATLSILGCAGLLGGCETPSFLDPGELAATREGRVREPLVVQVLDDLDAEREQSDRVFSNAQPPKQEDLVTTPTDYAVGPGDLLQVTVYDLEGQGLQTIKQVRISGTGNVALPYLTNVVRAEGLTEIELQTTIADAYREAKILETPNVSVSVQEARNRTYTVFGSVARPGTYVIADDEFRLLAALVQAGDVQNPLLQEVYVFRRTDKAGNGSGAPGAGPASQPAGAGAPDTTQPAGDDLAPPQSNSRRLPKGLTKSILLQEQGAADPLAPDAAPGEAPAAEPAPAPAIAAEAEIVPEGDDAAARVGRIDGQEVVVQPGEDKQSDTVTPVDQPGAATPTAAAASDAPFEFNEVAAPDNIRVIRIPLDKLRNGEFQYNIAIRPRDEIYIPPGVIGFYYMGGHVARPGPFEFRGQKVTLKQAITSVGGLDGLAIPQRTEIIRRIGPNEEMFVRVDLARIFAGKSPDIFLKPDDHVMVGTNFLAPFLAAVRGGFRMTYGFGFLYDRNFAYSEDQRQ
jgi:polysaccharide export outer membrane protein